MYAMICTRPDLSYALSMTSRYQANPGEGHWTAVKNILKYLRGTNDVFIVYGGEEELRIKGYTNKSSKQETVVDSTTKAENVSASEATKEIVWIKKIISELGVVPSISDATQVSLFSRLLSDGSGELKIENGGGRARRWSISSSKFGVIFAMDKESTNSSKDLDEIQKLLKSAAVAKSCFTGSYVGGFGFVQNPKFLLQSSSYEVHSDQKLLSLYLLDNCLETPQGTHDTGSASMAINCPSRSLPSTNQQNKDANNPSTQSRRSSNYL
ncbi:hypothetical protein GQ457_10G004790 [Hibiscus cannabinus]